MDSKRRTVTGKSVLTSKSRPQGENVMKRRSDVNLRLGLIGVVAVVCILLLSQGAYAFHADVSGGYDHSLVLKSDGTVWTAGRNIYGQLGDGSNTQRYSPVQVSDLTDVVKVRGGTYHSLALDSDGTVWAWGWNHYGQLGIDNTIDQNEPVQVSGFGGRKIKAISAFGYHSWALASDGTVWSWGYNGNGNLGIGNYIDQHEPAHVSALPVDIIDMSSDGYLVLAADGTVWGWGYNERGQLGIGNTIDQNEPIQISGLANVVSVESSSRFSLALLSDGTVYAWGDNYWGQLCDGTTSGSTIPVKMTHEDITNVAAIGAGLGTTFIRKNDGTVLACGRGSFGALCDGTYYQRSTPVVSGLSDLIALDGSNTTIGIGIDGVVRGCGRNNWGQLGEGSTTIMFHNVVETEFEY
jgi:alpha-tubulin suppressor-like RCC1 family protein